MATYTILTNRKQEIGLGYSYDTYANKTEFPTRESWLQFKVNHLTNGMYADQQRASSVAFDKSFNTIPEAEQPVARAEIEEVITSHGGTIIVPTPPPFPPNPTG